jgi:hypothetical protein
MAGLGRYEIVMRRDRKIVGKLDKQCGGTALSRRPLLGSVDSSTEPKCAVTMVAQFIVSIGMHEHVERSIIKREPTYDVGKLRRFKRDLVAPSRMRSDFSLAKAAHLNLLGKLRGHHFAKFIGRIAAGRIEIDMHIPASDTGHIEIYHGRYFSSRANPFVNPAVIHAQHPIDRRASIDRSLDQWISVPKEP